VLLDLSAAFDTVDHEILLDRLANRFGISGNALAWVKSYLTERCESVVIDGVLSEQHVMDCNVPQGSVLGPLLFTAYTSPLGDIVRGKSTDLHLYADDTQLYLAVKPKVTGAPENAIGTIEACISDIRLWMARNFLKLNDDKTEFSQNVAHCHWGEYC
jgi:hypothetical protein